MILISACLMGLNCKYNGKNNYHEAFTTLISKEKVIPYCPEQAGGLATPRPPAEILGADGFDVIKGRSKVITVDGKNVTDNFILGAKETLKIVKLLGIKKAILKSNSPSCGCHYIYDGSFSNKLKKGQGVTAACLINEGVRVIDSKEFIKTKYTN